MTYQTGTPTMTRWQPWSYRDQTWVKQDISGYKVTATDGEIGKVDKSMNTIDNAYLVVDTGGFLVHDKVMLPAGVVSGVDHNTRQVFVERTKDQVKNAPKFDQRMTDDPTWIVSAFTTGTSADTKPNASPASTLTIMTSPERSGRGAQTTL